ncbi:MAG: gliding motility-associated protein GldE [Bacteroidetes bacterium]|nr:gliding motility-associated protein GldE [Bacteroidota bacterium]
MEFLVALPRLFSVCLLAGIAKVFSTGIIVALLVIIILLFFSAMISASEIAYFSMSPPHLSKIRSSRNKKDTVILHLLGQPKYLLATILIANNFINLGVIVLSTYITTELFDLMVYPVLTFITQVVIVTIIILLFGEVMPKIYATQYPLKVANLMAGPLHIMVNLLFPLSTLLVRSTSIIDKRMTKRGHDISRDDLSEAINITSSEATPEEEKRILKSIVRFGDMQVSEVMKPRMDITAVDAKTTFPELLHIIIRSGYSRIPVYEDAIDNILGILYVKDLIPHLDKQEHYQWFSLLRPAFFIPENKKIDTLLQEFRDKKIHMAVVVDEYGGTSGLVTLEDIIEEIVGEISDEFDEESDVISYTKLDDHNYIFEGKTSINDFCKILDINDDIFDEVKGESDTLAGLILELMGKIPEKSDNIFFRNFVFRIESADRRRINKIRVTLNDETKENESS